MPTWWRSERFSRKNLPPRFSAKIPPFRPLPPGGGRVGLPITPRKEGRFDLEEITIYVNYLAEDDETIIDSFECTIEVPMTKKNRRKSDDFWELWARLKLDREPLGIPVFGEHWDATHTGFRNLGRTNSWKPRYVIIKNKGRNTATRWNWPTSGGWGKINLP